MPHMKFEVEILVFDPVRMIEPEWNIDEFLPEGPRPVQPFFDMPQDRFEALRAARQGTRVIDLEAGDVHRCPRRFEIQKRRVHCAELLHGRIPPEVYVPRVVARGDGRSLTRGVSVGERKKNGGRIAPPAVADLTAVESDQLRTVQPWLIVLPSSRLNSSRTSLPLVVKLSRTRSACFLTLSTTFF